MTGPASTPGGEGSAAKELGWSRDDPSELACRLISARLRSFAADPSRPPPLPPSHPPPRFRRLRMTGPASTPGGEGSAAKELGWSRDDPSELACRLISARLRSFAAHPSRP